MLLITHNMGASMRGERGGNRPPCKKSGLAMHTLEIPTIYMTTTLLS